MHRLRALILSDPQLLQWLEAVRQTQLPDAWLAAGALRNRVWDQLHGYPPSPLNDLDLIYFDASDPEGQAGVAAQQRLSMGSDAAQWQVKNQALMHHRNGHAPYRDAVDAMRYWPEQETAVAARLGASGEVEIAAPFGVESLLAGQLHPNPARPYALFAQRLESKGWLRRWPRLKVVR
ncbi:nucleotidyltransferase family protein [Ferrimonas marina]|uniref:Nitrate reductase n=1 Tax=Ferrimonas marina TaxID=299255 RepID=A0A1M5YC51_9GAMM|nr:nucleotidyltransferase family protein [Ferrimonas marina]SHI09428.1 hypothetical protein SAMN02745129_4053 [Ferrimonas marina]